MIDFINFAAERGVIIRNLDQGKWSRASTVDKPHKKNSTYFFGGDYGHVMNWENMDAVATWQANKPRSPLEQKQLSDRIEASRQAYANERANNQVKAAQKANFILSQCELSRHAYLDAHGFHDEIVNVWRKDEESEPLMIVPMFYEGKGCGAQCIGIDGRKKFLFGQRTTGAQFVMGRGNVHYWCEGYCTGLAVFKALGALKINCCVHVCFSANNLLNMAKQGYVIADNDASGTGERVAKETGLPYYLPDTVGDDFCDVFQKNGLFKSSQLLRKWLNSVK